MDNKNDEYCSCCSNSCKNIIYGLIIIFLLIIFSINFQKEYFPEEIFLKAIEKSWNRYPISNISLTKKKGYKEMTFMYWKMDDFFCDCTNIEDYETYYNERCSEEQIKDGCNEYIKNNENSKKLYKTTLYALYYEEDYLTLFKRTKTDKHEGKVCQSKYKKCGYLDSLNNPFCRRTNENCPINEISFSYGKDGIINKITTNNKRKDLPVFNQLIVSENENATIFDIGEFCYLNDDISDPERTRNNEEVLYSLLPLKNYSNINAIDFFKDNKLFKGKIPEKTNIKHLYLFYSIYPGNKYKDPFLPNFFNKLIIRREIRIILTIMIELLIIYTYYLNFFDTINKRQYKVILFIIFVDICFLVINFFRYKTKVKIYNILEDYNAKYNNNDYKEYLKTLLHFDIILLNLEVFGILLLIFFFCKNCNKQKNNSNESLISNESRELNDIDTNTDNINNDNENPKICKNKEKANIINENKKNEDNKYISINFDSSDQNIHYSFACKENDQFGIYKQKLLETYPEYKNKKIFFLSNGNKIDENKTLKENNIKDHTKIIINEIND